MIIDMGETNLVLPDIVGTQENCKEEDTDDNNDDSNNDDSNNDYNNNNKKATLTPRHRPP